MDINHQIIEILYRKKEDQMDILKNNRSGSVDVAEFLNPFLKQKIFVLIYSPYKELINYGITYEKKR